MPPVKPLDLTADFSDWTAFTAVTAEGTSLRDTLMQTIHKYVFDSKTPFIQNTYVLDANGKPMKEGRSGAISSTYGSMFAIQARRYGAADCLFIFALLIS